MLAVYAAPFRTEPYRSSTELPISVWFTDPPAYVTHFSAPYTLEARGAQFIIAAFRDGVRDLGPAYANAKFAFVHDWRSMRQYESGGRVALMSWGLEIRKQVASIDLVLTEQASTFLRMGAAVVESSFAAAGLPVRSHFGKQAQVVIQELGLKPKRASVARSA